MIEQHKETLNMDDPRDFIDLYLREIAAIQERNKSPSQNQDNIDAKAALYFDGTIKIFSIFYIFSF